MPKLQWKNWWGHCAPSYAYESMHSIEYDNQWTKHMEVFKPPCALSID